VASQCWGLSMAGGGLESRWVDAVTVLSCCDHMVMLGGNKLSAPIKRDEFLNQMGN
jgi:hypothetical protein